MEESRRVPLLIAVVGPTAAGKTALAVELTRQLGGEIISADSRQVYRRMDIGTAKPTRDEQGAAPHHLIDILDPQEWLNLPHYQALATEAITGVVKRGRIPLLVGGTGQYVRAVLEGWSAPEIAPDHGLRLDLEGVADTYGASVLFRRLQQADGGSALTIDYRNIRRVVRALEVTDKAGIPFSLLRSRGEAPYRILRLGVTRDRALLYERADRRVDAMIAAGLVEEVRRLHAAGCGWELPSMSSLGYAQIGQYLRGELPLEEAIGLIKRETRRYIRQQYNWFRLDDPGIHWFDLDRVLPEAVVMRVRSLIAAMGGS
ncbi:MAG: tRNA (adenosine(37)-N6)-dimethylallyltransferase MiaA [Anaerolineae bacterium]|nr:tRNA (adenosine(37)-N6)-dimethylallyltransferase MiaA [Anaerolineae bacterium]